jgi:peptidoglycan/LPS O-acetylase OafA/YrhL
VLVAIAKRFLDYQPLAFRKELVATVCSFRRGTAMRTFGSIMDQNRGVGPGFDFLRLALALSVVTWHSFQLSYGRAYSDALPEFAQLLSLFIVPSFFALSGYLVAGSMVRVKSVKVFLALRALRILPALAVEITLSALILGPIVTTLSIPQYISEPKFLLYFTNALGIIRYQLPGVFLSNPLPDVVNGQLWTVPSELHCYIALAILMLTRISSSRVLMLLAFALLATAECFTGLLPNHHYTMNVLNSPEMLVLSFLCGNVMFLCRDRIPSRLSLFFGAFAGYFVISYFVPALTFLAGALAITYATVFIGMQRVPRIPVLMRGDYSYGIYLYAFPLQQTVAWALPGLREWYFSLLVAGPLAVSFAMASWHFLEKPALSLKRHLVPRTKPMAERGPASAAAARAATPAS